MKGDRPAGTEKWCAAVRMCGVVIAQALLSVPSVANGAAPWKPAPVPISTEWGAQVTPENAWREYPRPRLVRPEWTCLNGLWACAVTASNAPRPSVWDGRILVPYAIESSLSGVGRPLQTNEALWYARTVATPAIPAGQRRVLRFEGVDWDAKVWVNGVEVGGNRGMNRRWACDITDATAGRSESEIVVRVLDATGGDQPRGKQSLKPEGCWYTRVSGIWQTVWLETVPDRHVTEVLAESLPDLSGTRVTVRATGGDGPVSVRMLDGGRPVATASGATGAPLILKPVQPKPWSPDRPQLYDLEVTLPGGETVRSYTAIRTCEVKTAAHGIQRLHLNGRPLFQYGPLDQGWWPESLLTPPSDAAQRWELEFLKQSGFTMLRKHLKVENDRYYRHCDEIGMLVWQDFPFPGSRKTTGGRAIFKEESASIVEQLRGFPCIVSWVVFNEMWEQFDEAGTKEMAAWTKAKDPTRVVNSASGWMDHGVGDVVDAHRYPGPAMPALDPVRAAVLGEFGGQGLAVSGHMWKAESWGYKDSSDPAKLAAAYAGFMDGLQPLIARGLCAAVYTQTSDVEIEKNGLLSYDRKVAKIPAARLRELHAPLYREMPPVRVLASTAERASVLWRITTNAPPPAWTGPGFDDAGWSGAPAGFGAVSSKYASGMTRIRTPWRGKELWLRREFAFDGPAPVRPALVIHADHKARVWLNGQAVAGEIERNNAGSYTIVPVESLPLAKGRNVLAVHVRSQTIGNQYIDAGLIDLGPRDP